MSVYPVRISGIRSCPKVRYRPHRVTMENFEVDEVYRESTTVDEQLKIALIGAGSRCDLDSLLMY
jgi:hypothetical protein